MAAAVRVEGISKRYLLGERDAFPTLRDAVARALTLPLRRRADPEGRVLWALQDVSFEVAPGEVLGVIGRNGAGKSTLLKVLSRITEPTAGRAEVRGRVASLLEVGTGFHPELTGRENVYLNGALLGMGRSEIASRFDEIVAFAEVEPFVDTPVKRYSSGMSLRLAFSVAAHLEAEVLLVDEVLAVGDAGFQKKCLARMEQVHRQGRTVLFVSHNMTAIRQLCGAGLLLSAGRVELLDTANACADRYLEICRERSGRIMDHVERRGSGVRIDSVLLDGSPDDRRQLSCHTRTLEMEVAGVVERPTRVCLELRIQDAAGAVVGTYSPGHLRDEAPRLEPGPFRMRSVIELPRFTRGDYLLDISITNPGVESFCDLPAAVELRAEGWPTRTGTVFENRLGAGSILLDGHLEYDTLPQEAGLPGR